MNRRLFGDMPAKSFWALPRRVVSIALGEWKSVY